MLLATRTVRMLTRIAISSIVFIVFALHVAASPRFEIIDRMENCLYDVRVRATMPGGIDERIVIVDIDEASQLQFGQWPWARATLASIVDTLFDDYRIKTLGFDVLFAEAERGDGNDAFAESFIARNVITGFVFKNSLSEGEPEFTGTLPTALIPASDLENISVPFIEAAGFTGSLPALQENALGGGFFDSPLIDSDGVFRRAPLVQRYRGNLYPTLALAVVRAATGSPPVGFSFAGSGRSGLDLEAFQIGDRKIPVNEQVAVFIPFRGPQESFCFIPANDIVNHKAPKERLSPERLRGRELQLLREVLATGAEGNYLDYISAEQAFMAVQMLVIELGDPYLEDQLDRIADTLNNDERYRPSRFAAMLAALAEPEPEAENIDEQDE